MEIEGIPPFKQKAVLQTDKKVNLIYGLNGTGKSTVSNLLYDMNKDGYTPKIKIEYDNNTDNQNSYEIIVYNKKFVRDNFYESNVINGIFSLSKDNALAQKNIENAEIKIKELDEKRKQKNDEKKELEDKIQIQITDTQNKIWEIKTKFSGSSSPFDFCLTGLKGEKAALFKHITSIQNVDGAPKRRIEEIENEIKELNSENAHKIQLINGIDINLNHIEADPIFQKTIIGNEKSSISQFIKEMGNSDWVKKGMQYICTEQENEIQKCPFCQQETIRNEFLQELKRCFDGAYKEDICKLNELLTQYQTEYNKMVEEPAFDKLMLLQSLKLNYKSAFSNLKSILEKNIELIKKKIENPSLSIEMNKSSEYIISLSKIIEESNLKIAEFNKRIEKKEETLLKLKDEFWNIMRSQYDAVLTSHNKLMNEFGKTKNAIGNEIEELDRKIISHQKTIVENREKTVNVDQAIKNINDALVDMGIVDFKIIKHSDSLYKLSREGQESDVFESLSEGEKLIISLLYFIERCKGNIRKDNSNRKKVIVIDDPISSLSHIYIYNVGRLLLREFTDSNPSNSYVKRYNQVFILTHSLYFFHEMAMRKHKSQDKANNQKLFRIVKDQQSSRIEEMKLSEIQNDYQAYWMIVKDPSSHPALIANCMRNIIEYFFGFIEKEDLNTIFNDEKFQSPNFQAFYRYINRESHSDGTNIFDLKEFNYDDFKNAFKLVFVTAGYEKHYNNMME